MSNNKDKKIAESETQEESNDFVEANVQKNTGYKTRVISILALLILVLGLSLSKAGMLDLSVAQEAITKVQKNYTKEVSASDMAEQELEIKQVMENAKKNQIAANGLLRSKDKVTNSSDVSNSESNTESISISSANKKQNSDLSSGELNQGIIKFAPEETELKEHILSIDEEDSLNPYDIEVGKVEYVATVSKQIMIKNATQYRQFLFSAHQMVEKFKTGSSYDDELRMLQMRVIPEEITEIVDKFAKYNELLKDKSLQPYKKINLGGKFLENFLQINEINTEYKTVSDLENEINAEMPMFYKYLYSDRLQAEFFGK